MRHSPVRRLTLAAALAFLASVNLQAETITADLAGVSPSQPVTVSLGGNTYTNVAAGIFNWVNVTPNNTFLGVAFQSYCIELTVLANGTQTFSTQALSPRYSATTALRLKEFWGENFASVAGDANKAAAFQLGLWEIVHESNASLDLSGGDVRDLSASIGVIPTAQAMLNNVNGHGTFEDGLVVLDSVGSQDQIVPQVVPVPTAVILGGIGLVGLVGYGLRRRIMYS